MQHDVALLGLGAEIGQTLPIDEVFCAGDTTGSGSCAEVAWLTVVMTFYAEEPIDPTILMSGETHIIDVGGWSIEARQTTAFWGLG